MTETSDHYDDSVSLPDVPPRLPARRGEPPLVVEIDNVEGKWIPYRNRYAVPERFSVILDEPTYRVVATVEVDVETKKPGVVAVTCERYPGQPYVTGVTLRDVRVAEIVKRGLALVAWERTDEGAVIPVVASPTATASERVESFLASFRTEIGQPAKKGVPMTPKKLKQVAELYRAAILTGISTRLAVSEGMCVAPSTAGRYVVQARRRGYLGPTVERRRGEMSIPEGEEK